MPQKRVEWTVEWAAAEFGINPRTLVARIKQSGINGRCRGKKVLYTTKQIASAVYGDLELERIRKTKEEADQLEMENEVERKRLIPADQIMKRLTECGSRMRTIIESSKIDEEAQIDLLNQLSKLAGEL